MDKKDLKKFYAFGTYKPNKMAKPVTYKGTEYLSKAQCMALEGITREELDAYLKGEVNEPAQEQEIVPNVIEPINKLGVIEDLAPEEENLRHNPLDELYDI